MSRKSLSSQLEKIKVRIGEQKMREVVALLPLECPKCESDAWQVILSASRVSLKCKSYNCPYVMSVERK